MTWIRRPSVDGQIRFCPYERTKVYAMFKHVRETRRSRQCGHVLGMLQTKATNDDRKVFNVGAGYALGVRTCCAEVDIFDTEAKRPFRASKACMHLCKPSSCNAMQARRWARRGICGRSSGSATDGSLPLAKNPVRIAGIPARATWMDGNAPRMTNRHRTPATLAILR